MPFPAEYQRASAEFDAFLLDARDEAGLQSPHQAYTMVQGVLQAFRRRLTVPDAIRFASVLPAVLRALFVADWDTGEPRRAFADRAVMTAEAQALRANHNFSPPTAILDVASALRRHVDVARFDEMLACLPEGAVEFWQARSAASQSTNP